MNNASDARMLRPTNPIPNPQSLIPLQHAPVSALVAIVAYLARQPVVKRGSSGLKRLARSASSSSLSRTLSVWPGMSISMMSPCWIRPIGPPTAASGLTWPMRRAGRAAGEPAVGDQGAPCRPGRRP